MLNIIVGLNAVRVVGVVAGRLNHVWMDGEMMVTAAQLVMQGDDMVVSCLSC